MRRAIALIVTLGCAAAWGQALVQINFTADDRGEVWVNGATVAVDTDFVGHTTVRPGRNVIAARVRNDCWGGGFAASIDLHGVVDPPDTPRTDSTWRCTDYPVSGDEWMTDTAFDDSRWQLAGDYGALDTVRLCPYGRCPVPGPPQMFPFLLADNVHWLWTPKRVYMRRSFTCAVAETGSVMIRGNGFAYTLYLNDRQVSQRSSAYVMGAPITKVDNQPLLAGENVIAIDATCLDSIDNAFLKAAVQWNGGGSKVGTDSTWKYSWSATAGWNNTAFDDSQWLHVGNMPCEYDRLRDSLTTSATFVWVTDMVFRKVFTVSGALRTSPAGRARAPTQAILRSEYYSLSGSRIASESVKQLQSNSLFVKVIRFADGRRVSELSKLVR